jgi:hypothetical protein
MPRFVADENFNNHILRGLLPVVKDLDIIRVQDTSLYSQNDQQLLDWAADKNRILLTHDYRTIPPYAYERVRRGQKVAGVIILPRWMSVGEAIDELVLVAELSVEGEWEGRVDFLPLR